MRDIYIFEHGIYDKSAYHDIAPLVELDRKITVRLNPFSIRRIHDRLTGWTYGYWLRKFRLT